MKVKLYPLLFVLALASVAASASSLVTYLSFEDTPITGDRDFNDITATVTGAVLHQTGGVFSVLTAALVNPDNGAIFWDHVSSDGPNDNIGNVWLTTEPGAQYLATPSGGLVSTVYFSGGSTVTITGGQTADTDKLFECALGGTGCQAVNGSLTFTPTGDWELMAQVNGGAKYYSDPTWQQSSSFAFAQGTEAPEPNAGLLALAGLGFVLMSRRWRRVSK
jgi:hypothetical protein